MGFPRNEFLKRVQAEGKSQAYINAISAYISTLDDADLPVIFDSYHLADLLGISYDELKLIANRRSGYYKYYCIKKRTSGFRRIMAPYSNLKKIQRWILTEILEKVPLSPSATGFRKGYSIVTNAKTHENQKYIEKFDLRNFFESISMPRVYGFFHSLGYGKQVSYDLALICTTVLNENKLAQFDDDNIADLFDELKNYGNGFLVQGAPSSPSLANHIAYKLDSRLKNYADKHGINYSRYADDITFSSNDKNLLPNFSLIRRIVEEEGFQLNGRKTGMFSAKQRQDVTGLLINDHVHISSKFKREVQRHLYFCKKFGARDHFDNCAKDKTNADMWLLGKIRFIYQVEPEVGKQMLKEFDEINWF